MESRHDTLAQLYAAFNRRDIEAVLASLSPDVNWPNGMDGGRVHGRDGVRAYWRRQWNMIDPNVDPVRIEDTADGSTAVAVHQVIRDLSGQILKDMQVRHVYRSRDDGLVERMDIAPSDPPAAPAP